MPSPNISFDNIPSTIRKPGVYSEYNTKLAVRTLPANLQKMLIIGQRLGARIEPEIWQGGTLDNMTSGGTYTGATVKKFRVKISTIGTPDNFVWSADDGATWSGNVAITGSAQALSDGVTVTFAATTGHALADEWRFNAYPEPSVAEKVVKQLFSDSEAASYFGYGSMAQLMARAAIKSNAYLDLTLVTLADAGAGVVATGTVTITVTAVTAGSLRFYIGNDYVDVAIAQGDTPTKVATNLCNAIAAKSDLPVTASNAAGVVTLTAKNKGLCGNDIGMGYDITTGIGTTLAVVALASGATNPVLQDALTLVYGSKYDVIVTPYNNQTDLTTLRTHIDSASGSLEKRRCIGVYGMNGALSSATTLSAQMNAGRLNSPYLRYTTATKKRSMPYEIACAYGSLIAGTEDAAANFDAKEIKGIAVPDITDRLSRTEQESCLYNGVAPIEVGPGEKVHLVRAVTTYLKNAVGVDDISLLELSTVRALDYGTKAVEDRQTLRFAGAKKTARVKASIKSEIIDVMKKLEQLEIWENVDANLDGILVEDDSTDPNRVNVKIPADVVNGLHVIANRIDLIL